MTQRIGDAPAAGPDASAAFPQGTVLVGVLPGLLGGLAMLAFLMFASGLAGLGWLHPLESIGVTLVAEGTARGVATVSAGALLHAVASIAFGVCLAAVLPAGFPPGSAAAAGVAYGLAVAGVMMSLVVPAVNPAFRAAIQPVGGSWTIGHVVFGATLGLTLALRHRVPAREPGRRAAAVGTVEPT